MSDFINKIIRGNCLEVLPTLPDNSVDSIVTDPPYELGFMGKAWDNTGIANNLEMWKQCLRVLKPGGHLLAFSGTRTYHRMACAIEDAGFEVRDMIEWVYGSGFPKSLNIGKAVDKLQGNEREVVGSEQKAKPTFHSQNVGGEITEIDNIELSKGTSPWEGWGTALKPSHEPICMARKPIEKGLTIAENCLKWGTGGINIDESRVGVGREKVQKQGISNSLTQVAGRDETNLKEYSEDLGRFPANLIHDGSEEVRECFPETKQPSFRNGDRVSNINGLVPWNKGRETGREVKGAGFTDTGNASRFFKSIIYQAKASKGERNKGCEKFEPIRVSDGRKTEHHVPNLRTTPKQNFHPTVKPIALMEYLIKMVTPKGGVVLDPFAGSGSTLVAAKENGFQFIGIEMTPDYIPIIEARIKEANGRINISKARIENAKRKNLSDSVDTAGYRSQLGLFDGM